MSPLPPGFTDGMSPEMEEVLKKIWTEIMTNRDQIVKAFIAETGYSPVEVVQEVQFRPDGVLWRVRKFDPEKDMVKKQ